MVRGALTDEVPTTRRFEEDESTRRGTKVPEESAAEDFGGGNVGKAGLPPVWKTEEKGRGGIEKPRPTALDESSGGR